MEAGLLGDLTGALWRWSKGDFASARSAGVDDLVARCGDAGRRREVERFVELLGALPEAERRDVGSALDQIQVRSKLWLIDELAARRDLAGSTLFVLGGWYGVLPMLCNWRLDEPPRRMVSVDVDPRACELGRRVIGAIHPNVEHRCADVMELDYAAIAGDGSPIVINTICEHLPDIRAWWDRVPAGQFVVLQNNNYRACRDHVNAVAGVREMLAQTPLSDLQFAGELHVPELVYDGGVHLPALDRFMLVGRR